MPELFDKHGGFRRLHAFTLATIAQVETLRFCRRFLTFDHRQAGEKFYDPKGRQYDQMTQAARSGRQNIIEGSERAATSKDTEMKLTDVARASLSELRGDYEIFILDRGQLPWSVHAPEAQAVNAVSLDPAPFADDMVHESAKHALEQRKKYARWLDADDAVVVANAMLILLGRALNMLKGLVEAQGKAFEKKRWFWRAAHGQTDRGARKGPVPVAGLPAVRQTHASAQVGERRLLGVLRLPRVQRNKADANKRKLTLLTPLTLLAIGSMKLVRPQKVGNLPHPPTLRLPVPRLLFRMRRVERRCMRSKLVRRSLAARLSRPALSRRFRDRFCSKDAVGREV